MNLRSLLIASASILPLSGCDNEPAAGKTQAMVEEATEPPTASTATEVRETRYVFSNENSKVRWVGAKVTGKHDGLFEKFSGEIRIPDGKLEGGHVNVSIESASLESDTEKLTKHLKSADFFDVDTFPRVQFTSTAVTEAAGDGSTHTIKGNLTLHGVTKSIIFPAKLEKNGNNVTAEAEFAINRKDFGIVYPGMPDDLIKDDVLVRLDIRAAVNTAIN